MAQGVKGLFMLRQVGAARRWYWVAVLLGLAMLSFGILSDRYIQTWDYEDMAERRGTVSNGSVYGDVDNLAAGPFTLGPVADLKAGRYQLILRYAVTAPGNRVEVTCNTQVDTDNNIGAIYTTAELPVDETEHWVDFTLETPAREVAVQTYFCGTGSFTLHSITLRHQGLYYTDHLLLVLVLFVLALLLDHYLYRRPLRLGQSLADRVQVLLPWGVAIGFALFASYPLFADWLHYGHDMAIHMTRIEGVAEGIGSGQFPVRIHPAQLYGKGYAIGAMYPDLLIWPFALLHLCGVSLLGCYQALLICLNLATALIAYACISRLFSSRWVGLTFSLLYTLSAYRLLCLYVRGAVGEISAMVFLPLAAWGIYEVIWGNRRRWPLLVVGVTGVFQSHIISTVFLVILLVVCCLLGVRRLWAEKDRMLSILKAAGLFILVNLWFIVPFLYYSGQGFTISGLVFDVWDYAVYPSQLFMSGGAPRGDAIRLGTITGEMLLAPGFPLLFAAAFLLAAICYKASTQKESRPMCTKGLALLLGTVCVLWTMTTYFPWQYLQNLPVVGAKIDAIQFPWRLLSIATLLLSLCGALAAALFKHNLKRGAKIASLAVMAAFCMFGATLQVDPAMQAGAPLNRFKSVPVHVSGDRLYLYPETPYMDLADLPDTIQADDETLTVWDYQKSGTTLSFSYSAEALQWLELPLTWYPGYQAKLTDGTILANEGGPIGQMRLTNIPLTGSITVRYVGFWYFRVTDCASLLTIAGLIAYGIRRKIRKRQTRLQQA